MVDMMQADITREPLRYCNKKTLSTPRSGGSQSSWRLQYAAPNWCWM